MMTAFDATIDALLPDWPVLQAERRSAVSAHCAQFVRGQIALSPAHIRFGVHTLFVAFCAFARLRLGMRPLAACPRERRAAAMRAFAPRQLAQLAALERVLRSMTMVSFLEHPDVLTAIGEQVSPSDAAASTAAP